VEPERLLKVAAERALRLAEYALSGDKDRRSKHRADAQERKLLKE